MLLASRCGIVAILQALLALLTKSAGKLLNAIFGWAVRALFGRTTSTEQTFLSGLVGAAVAWPLLVAGVAAPRIAALVLALVPIPRWIPSWSIRLVWLGLALIVPLAMGIAVTARGLPERLESYESPELTVSFYASGVLLRGLARQVTWAHGLIAEAATGTDGLQTLHPAPQDLEKQIKQVWKTFAADPDAHVRAPRLLARVGEISVALGSTPSLTTGRSCTDSSCSSTAPSTASASCCNP